MSRDAPLPALSDLPTRPAWLKSPEAIREFHRLTSFMLTHQLLNSGNVQTVAHLAALHGKIAEMWADGTPPVAALLATYRGMAASLVLLSLAAPPMKNERLVNRFANNAARKTRA